MEPEIQEPPVESDERERLVCPTCLRTFVSTTTLNKHRNKGRCNGLLRLQCGKCRQTFRSKQEKYRHSLVLDCTKPDNRAPPTNDLHAALPPALPPLAPLAPLVAVALVEGVAALAEDSVEGPATDPIEGPAAPPAEEPVEGPAAASTSSGAPAFNVENNINNGTIINGPVNNGTIINGPVNNGTINNVVINLGNPPATRINDFMNTNTQVVIDSISRNPAFMQLAHEKNALPEAVLAETHFHGALENRNVLSADKYSPYVNVVTSERRLAISKKMAAEESIRNMNTIVNSPMMKPFFSDDLTKPVLPVPQTKSEARELRTRITRLFYNKGHYVEADLIKVPSGTPVFVDQCLLVDMLLAVVVDQQSPYRHDVSMYQEVTLAACSHFVFNETTGKWFKGLPNGWEVCRDVARVESEIHIVLNELKNDAKVKAASDAKLRIGVDYFPDRLVAAAAVAWVVDASVAIEASSEVDALEAP